MLEKGKETPNLNYADVLAQVYRSMHLIKGNASLLAIQFFADQAHKFETKISELQQNQKLSNEDIAPLRMELEKIKIMLNEVNKLLEKISQIHAHMRPKREYEHKLLVHSLNNMVLRSIQESGKQIRLKSDNFQAHLIPHQYKLLLREALIQLVRNSVAHGIEDSEERIRMNKPPEGTIEIETVLQNQHICLRVKDDGRGLQLDKLKQSAKKLGRWSEEEINKWSDKEIAHSIFISGITTAQQATLEAGRGVGLDAVREKIEKHNGTIELDFETGKYCRFEICLQHP
jgi:Amt family ammonium transporter